MLPDSLYAKQNYPTLGLRCLPPALGFSLIGKASAVSRLHCDPEGASSVVRIESGAKLWAVMVEGPPNDNRDESSVLANAYNFRNWSKARWDVAFLEAGDTM